jgi:uncharacterized protein (TIGR02996 family)
MSSEATLLAALHAHAADDTCWLALADALEETGQSERAEITRLLTRLRRTPDHAERPGWEERLRALLAAGVRPCVSEVVNSVGMRLALIPPGLFWMGSTLEERNSYGDERPRHVVEITRPFYLGVFPVTQTQYEAVMGINPSFFQWKEEGSPVPGLPENTSDLPVDSVSWEDATAFCQRLSKHPAEKKARRSYRLPTEAEWEYACRAGTTTPFHFGNIGSSALVNCDAQEAYGSKEPGIFLQRPTVVGSYLPNGFGLYDMHGNINEWCSDWFSPRYYDRSPAQDPRGSRSGSEKVFRGGCWNFFAPNCRSGYRGSHRRDESRRFNGLRVVLKVNRASAS